MVSDRMFQRRDYGRVSKNLSKPENRMSDAWCPEEEPIYRWHKMLQFKTQVFWNVRPRPLIATGAS